MHLKRGFFDQNYEKTFLHIFSYAFLEVLRIVAGERVNDDDDRVILSFVYRKRRITAVKQQTLSKL